MTGKPDHPPTRIDPQISDFPIDIIVQSFFEPDCGCSFKDCPHWSLEELADRFGLAVDDAASINRLFQNTICTECSWRTSSD
jgi:hypothetical protein